MIPFSDEEIYHAVRNHLPEVKQYIASHGGDIRLLGVKDGSVYIELTGACHGCSMSLMTTKMVVQRKLRELIHPELNVINVDGSKENALPEEYYSEEEEHAEAEGSDKKEGMIEKIKKVFK